MLSLGAARNGRPRSRYQAYRAEIRDPDLAPAIPATDKVIEDGSVGPLVKLVADASEVVFENASKRYLLQNTLEQRVSARDGRT
jgi:hypothetical protein